jgi:NAD(P)-dependent dehydrogenase (short-subunit alcohol dehydrogenase family)
MTAAATIGPNRDTVNRAVHDLGPRAHGITADVTRASEIEALYREIKEKLGRLEELFAHVESQSLSRSNKSLR